MAVDNVLYLNECGLPLNSVEWLITHHESKRHERTQMIRDLPLKRGGIVLDAGCGPGLWIPLLAEAIGEDGTVIGVDVSSEALVTAQQRSKNAWYQKRVQYKCATLEQLPIMPGIADAIFSANVSQYLPRPVETFIAMGRYLAPGGLLAIKDIDFSTMYFHYIDVDLQTRVFRARACWEQERIKHGYAFEDSWVGSKLAGYLRMAGYQDVQEKVYHVVRRYPLSQGFRTYLQGIGSWFVTENAAYLSDEDRQRWLQYFFDDAQNVLDKEGFFFEETEYLVTGQKSCVCSGPGDLQG